MVFSKKTSGLLMSVIRTLSASETNEQREKEKAKLEAEYKQSDKRLDELVSRHEGDLTKVMQLFSSISSSIRESREKIRTVKENLKACKSLLHCRSDELRKLWTEHLEYKYMLQLLEKIETLNDIPNKINFHLSRKQYLHATNLLIEAVSLGKENFDGVEGLKELSQNLEVKKENLHIQLLHELKNHIYVKTAQNALALRRQGSGRDFLFDSPLQRSTELRLSARQRAVARKNILDISQLSIKDDDFEVEENLNIDNPEKNSAHFIAILIKCFAILEKLPFLVEKLKTGMQSELLIIVQHTTYHVNDVFAVQGCEDSALNGEVTLLELMHTLFEQFRQIGKAQEVIVQYLMNASKAHKVDVKLYDMKFYWGQVQVILQFLLNDYLDMQNMSNDSQLIPDNFSNNNDLSSYFSRRKQQTKKKALFKFDSASGSVSSGNSSKEAQASNKVLVCPADSENILTVFVPLINFVDEIEKSLELKPGSSSLNQFLSNNVKDVFLIRKRIETLNQIEAVVRAVDAWKSTILLDATTDYKPLLVSTVNVEKIIRKWTDYWQALPLYGEDIVRSVSIALREYRETCHAAYQGIVQPHSEDRRICSAAWLKDEDISRFLKSLPNWMNLKAQQEHQARHERKVSRAGQELHPEEESPEDIRQRNRREAEILASNLGEGGVSSGEILSDMSLLKELAQLQESMEWFSVRMLHFASQFRHEPTLAPPKPNAVETPSPVSSATLHQLTSVAQDFDELANTCLLLLHLEVRVQCFHYLLAQSDYNAETHEPDPKVLELSRVLANVDEAMTSSLHPRKCKYIFEGLGHLIAKILISSSQYRQVINEAGIQRMCRNIFALQQTLTNITMTREVALDHARHYFELFFLTPEEILNSIVEKGPEFSELEYMNAFQLLNRSKAEKDIGNVNVHLERLSDILGEVGVQV
ncbi:exocyst complex component 4 isoform X3 [Agrilus planipennis]|uniref:Exocyst complex component Sec8 n=1 Tax=Agrilus planipennis TaxID=224129 RepID=A0A7F5R378_AGRPL|nr:exocyst complex component 4 isoform X3 [Agrilus planipennis]XP_025829670.1 exocyst complex component 4 isoform X3 [Agrilus planipennis]